MIRGKSREGRGVPEDAFLLEEGEGIVPELLVEVVSRVFQGQAEGKHPGIVQSGDLRLPW
jgi:hypothetical protein